MSAKEIASEDIPHLNQVLNEYGGDSLEDDSYENDKNTSTPDIGQKFKDKVGKADRESQNSKNFEYIGNRRVIKGDGPYDKVEEMYQK